MMSGRFHLNFILHLIFWRSFFFRGRCKIFPKDTLEKLDATFKVSPENEYLYEVVRRIEQANQTRDPVTGRIRFFRPEDSVLSKMGKTGMYAVLILPAAMYYVVRAVLIPNSVHFMQAVWHY